MKQFTIFRIIHIVLHLNPMLGIAFIPKMGMGEDDNNNIILAFLFLSIGIEIKPRQERKRHLITAKVENNYQVKVSGNGYDDYLTFKLEKDINELDRIFVRNSFGEYDCAKSFSYDEKMDRYIVKHYKGAGNYTRISLYRPDEVRLFNVDQEVRGYIRSGRFIVVS